VHDTKLRSTFSEMSLAQGDLLRIVSPGGGGFGPPGDRAPEAVAADVRAGKVSAAAARSVYQVAMDGDGGSVAHDETARLRRMTT
jgi:N-methylhydantoinase B